jgi:glycosyltransferase involved in cell wall biosynthesis
MPDLKKRFDELKNECKAKIFCIGLVSDSEMDWLYENCQAVIVSSESEGNFPTQLSEAIYFGRPFIASNLEVVLEGLDNIESSNLFESGSSEDLYAKMENLLKNLSSEQFRAQENRRNFNEKRLSMAKSGILSVVNEVFNGK